MSISKWSEGVKTIGVTWGFQDKADVAASKPDYVVDTPEDLLTIIEKL